MLILILINIFYNSHLLSRRGLTPRIRNLVGKLEFTGNCSQNNTSFYEK